MTWRESTELLSLKVDCKSLLSTKNYQDEIFESLQVDFNTDMACGDHCGISIFYLQFANSITVRTVSGARGHYALRELLIRLVHGGLSSRLDGECVGFYTLLLLI